MGNILAVDIHAANIHDSPGGCVVLENAYDKYPSLNAVCGDDGYRGTLILFAYLMGLRIDISKKIKPEWQILPWRWVVERTFAWLLHSRRLSKDYEICTSSEKSFIFISHFHTLLKRLR